MTEPPSTIGQVTDCGTRLVAEAGPSPTQAGWRCAYNSVPGGHRQCGNSGSHYSPDSTSYSTDTATGHSSHIRPDGHPGAHRYTGARAYRHADTHGHGNRYRHTGADANAAADRQQSDRHRKPATG